MFTFVDQDVVPFASTKEGVAHEVTEHRRASPRGVDEMQRIVRHANHRESLRQISEL